MRRERGEARRQRVEAVSIVANSVVFKQLSGITGPTMFEHLKQHNMDPNQTLKFKIGILINTVMALMIKKD